MAYRVKLFNNFLSSSECEALNKVAKQGIEEGWICPATNKQGFKNSTRYTNRSRMHTVEYPQVVRDMSAKVRKFVGVDKFPIITGHGRDGVVVSVVFKGGDVHKHKDARSYDGLATYRCNVLTQANEDGCDIYVDGEKVTVEVGDLHCYMVSEFEHYVTEAKGDTPRIMWMFGAHIPLERLGEYL